MTGTCRHNDNVGLLEVYKDVKTKFHRATVNTSCIHLTEVYTSDIASYPNEQAPIILEEGDYSRLKRFKPTGLSIRVS